MCIYLQAWRAAAAAAGCGCGLLKYRTAYIARFNSAVNFIMTDSTSRPIAVYTPLSAPLTAIGQLASRPRRRLEEAKYIVAKRIW